MIAGEQVPVVFEGQGRAAFLGKHAETRPEPHPVPERHVEQLDEYLANIFPYPLIEDADEELTVMMR